MCSILPLLSYVHYLILFLRLTLLISSFSFYFLIKVSWRFHNLLLLLLLSLKLKPAAQAKVGISKLFINWFRYPTSTCATKTGISYEPRSAGNTCKFGRSTPWYFKLLWMSCRTFVEADGSSLNKQLFEFQWTLHNIHSPETWRRWHNDKKLWSVRPRSPDQTWRPLCWRWRSAAASPTRELLMNKLHVVQRLCWR